ncbi:MAG TPA: PTS glucose/sucrose transporter subunit IIB, partial [Polyangia bacterium]|nr:PTS glucose/sucrose transporter subunit IIB [Polyangia bacterium]
DRALAFIPALGGAANFVSVAACATRLRLVLAQPELVNEPALKALGAKGVVRLSDGGIQVVLGPQAELIADEIRLHVAPAEEPRRRNLVS